MPELLMEMFFVSRNMLNILKNNGETDVHSVRRTVSVKQENNNIHYINICFPFCKWIGEISKDLKMLMFLFKNSILLKCISLKLKNRIKDQIQQWAL